MVAGEAGAADTMVAIKDRQSMDTLLVSRRIIKVISLAVVHKVPITKARHTQGLLNKSSRDIRTKAIGLVTAPIVAITTAGRIAACLALLHNLSHLRQGREVVRAAVILVTYLGLLQRGAEAGVHLRTKVAAYLQLLQGQELNLEHIITLDKVLDLSKKRIIHLGLQKI